MCSSDLTFPVLVFSNMKDLYACLAYLLNVGVNKPFKRYAKQAYKTFMFGNTNTGKVRREGIVK